MFGRKAALPVFTIVDADPSDPLAALRFQEASQAGAAFHDANEDKTIDWREILDQHLKEVISPVRETLPAGSYFQDTSDRLSDDFLSDFMAEINGIMSGPNVRWMMFDENGDLVDM